MVTIRSIQLTSLVLCAIGTSLFASDVTPEQITKAANAFIRYENAKKTFRASKESHTIAKVNELMYRGEPVGSIVELSPSGFMLVPSVTDLSPVKFVSFDGKYENVKHLPFFTFVAEEMYYAKQQNRQTRAYGSSRATKQTSDAQSAWDFYLSSNAETTRAFAPDYDCGVGPLMTSRWNQENPYNLYTPLINGNHGYTGCVATSISQIMYFWKYPSVGQGSHSYPWTLDGGDTQTLSANFDHRYDWAQMLNTYTGAEANTDPSAMAVGRLMSDVGIALDMNYQVNGSGTMPETNNALVTYFKYNPLIRNIHWGNYADNTEWFWTLAKQNLQGLPINLTITPTYGESHSVVMDGYRIVNNQRQIHINMGWGGLSDSFYAMDNVAGYTEYSRQTALVDIYPSTRDGAYLHVSTFPSSMNANILVDGATMGRGAWSGKVSAGTHTISFADCPPYLTPAPQTVSVATGTTKPVLGQYVFARLEKTSVLGKGSFAKVRMNGAYAYCAARGGGLVVLNMSNPSQPTQVSALNVGDVVLDVALSGNRAYLACASKGLVVVDISSPSSPSMLGSCVIPSDSGTISSLDVSGSYAYMACRNALAVVNLADPSRPAITASVATTLDGQIAASGSYVYAASSAWYCGGIRIFDVSNPAAPVLSNTFTINPGRIPGVRGFNIAGTRAYADFVGGGFAVLDLSSPTNPVELGRFATSTKASDIQVSGDYAFLAEGSAGIQVLNIANPQEISEVVSLPTRGSASDLALSGSNLVVAELGGGVSLLNVTNPLSTRWEGRFATEFGSPNRMTTVGNYAFITDVVAKRLAVVDLTNMASPALLGSFSANLADMAPVACSGNRLLVFDMTVGLRLLDVSNPSAIKELGCYVIPDGNDGVMDFTVCGDYAYVAKNGTGILVVNLAIPGSLSLAGTYTGCSSFSPGTRFFMVGTYLYLADDYSSTWRIFDLSNPASPAQLSEIQCGSALTGAKVVDGKLYAVESGALNLWDVSDPTKPQFIGRGYGDCNDLVSVDVNNNVIYATSASKGLVCASLANMRAPIFSPLLDVGPSCDLQIRNGYVLSTGGASGTVTLSRIVAQASVTSNDPPVISSITIPTATNVGISESFSVSATDASNDILIYRWDFGDGTVATSATATHAYATRGTYTVIVSVKDPSGLSDTRMATINVGSEPGVYDLALNGDPNISQYGSDDGSPMYFKLVTPPNVQTLTIGTLGYMGSPGDADLYVKEGSKPTKRSYTYRSMNIGNVESINVSSPANKTWYVMVTPKTSGATGILIYAKATLSANAAPKLGKVSIPTCGTAGQTLSFSATATDADRDTLSYHWDFGDGTSANTASAKHTYTAEGRYGVKVTVTDTKGASDSQSATLLCTIAAPTITQPANQTEFAD